MDVSVIIVNYNTCKMTRECIDSIFENTKYITFEIILIDNASIDESKVVFEKDDRIKYIYNQMNIGFGQANNIGLEIAIGVMCYS
jgi:GT2 family glycosyltransferase